MKRDYVGRARTTTVAEKDHIDVTISLRELWAKRLYELHQSGNPLKGVYCVYSMYWRPNPPKYQP